MHYSAFNYLCALGRLGAVCLVMGALQLTPVWASTPSFVALPVLPSGPIELRVAHVINPRLPRMSDAQIETFLAATTHTAREHFGVELRFSPVVQIPIATLFATIPPARQQLAAKDVYNFKSSHVSALRLERAFGRGFRSAGESLAGMVAYAKEHAEEVDQSSYETFGASMAALQLNRVAQWQTRQALDGRPAIDASNFNEFAYWLELGYDDLPYELLITNQIVASVEYSFPAVHAAVRGGYTNGVTSYSRLSRFGTYSVWSTYAYTENDEQMVQLRAGERYSPQEAAELAGIAATHELGHQLFHLLHPFGQTACVMNPVPMFSYRAWAERLRPQDCRLGSNPAMVPGAVKFAY